MFWSSVSPSVKRGQELYLCHRDGFRVRRWYTRVPVPGSYRVLLKGKPRRWVQGKEGAQAPGTKPQGFGSFLKSHHIPPA